MSKKNVVAWKHGNTLSLSLQVQSGSAEGTELERAVLKQVGPGNTLPAVDAPEVAVFAQTFDQSQQIWFLTLTPAQRNGLAEGLYVTDARFVVADVVYNTQPIFIETTAQVTGPQP